MLVFLFVLFVFAVLCIFVRLSFFESFFIGKKVKAIIF